jgi:hypothetical protein
MNIHISYDNPTIKKRAVVHYYLLTCPGSIEHQYIVSLLVLLSLQFSIEILDLE